MTHEVLARRARILGCGLLAYMSAAVLGLTLVPFDFRVPDALVISWALQPGDLVTNVALFVPIGFLVRLASRREGLGAILLATAYGAGLSAGVEAVQVFAPDRYTQVIDVIANAGGALLGAWGYGLARAWGQGRAARILALELPLANLVYLLLPLLWVVSLAAGRDPGRLALSLAPGAFGVALLAEVYARRHPTPGVWADARAAAVFAGWFLVGLAPAFGHHRALPWLLAASVAAFGVLLVRWGRARPAPERRFEIPTLRRALPFFLVYVAALATWPLAYDANAAWHPLEVFARLPFPERLVETFRFLELVTAFTYLGYMLAELRGRAGDSGAGSLGRVGLRLAGVLLLLVVVRLLVHLPVWSGWNLGISLAGGIYGAVLFRLQLAAFPAREASARG